MFGQQDHESQPYMRTGGSPAQKLQAGDVAEVGIAGGQWKAGLQRDGRDPNVVLRDGSTRVGQLCGDATVKLWRGFIGEQNVHGLNPKSQERRRAALLATAGCMAGEEGEEFERAVKAEADRIDGDSW